MAYQNRSRGPSRLYQESDSSGRRQGQRYPGSSGNEFSQFGGPRPSGYREYGGASSEYAERDRDYGQRGYGRRYEEAGSAGYRSDDDDRRYRYDDENESYASQRSGYPDYSGYQQRRGGSQGYGYASQDRGNIDQPMDRDWGSYGQDQPYGRQGFSQRQAGYAGQGGYGGQWGYGGQREYGQQGG